MQTTLLSSLLSAESLFGRPDRPVATVCADVTHLSEAADTELELRVRAVDRRLAVLGAPQPLRTAVADRLLEGTTDPQASRLRGRALVAADDGTVLLDTALLDAPRREVVEYSPLPDLLPVLRQLPGNLPHIVVVADRVGADLDVVGAAGEPEVTESLDGETQYLHKVHVGGWSHLRYLHTAEDVWRRNADRVADQLTRRARAIGARFVLVAGEERARQVLLDRLPQEVAGLVVTTDAGGRAAGADRTRIARFESALVAEQFAYEDAATAERLAGGLHRGDAVTGLDAVLEALRKAQVGALVLAPEGVDLEVRVGPGPLDLALRAEDLAATAAPCLGFAPADRALLRAAAATGSDVVVLPRSLLPNGIPVAALLRFVETPSTDLTRPGTVRGNR